MAPSGRDAHGVSHVAVTDETPDQVSMSNRGLVSVDLTGTPSCVTSLSLAANSLTFVNMSPLSSCAGLSAVILNGNKLADLDLAPLENAPRLERLWLHNNALTQLDLSPLRRCTALRSLYLDGNRFDKIPLDLSPLAECGRQLRALRLGRNRLSGELDITPLLKCGSLSTLDTCASVKLTAKTDGAVPAPLPPALRRRAATVHWVSTEEEPECTEPAKKEASFLNDLPGIESVSRSPMPGFSSPRALHQFGQVTPGGSPALAAAQLELVNARDIGDDSPQSEGEEVPSLPESESLEELAALCSSPRAAGTHAVVMVGFRRSWRFSAEALLKDHARLTTAFVASPRASAADALIAAGALKSCAVFLVRPSAVALVAALRARDGDVPIVVVGSEEERDGKCEAAGATCFLYEPLGPRDALIIRSLALQRARSGKPSQPPQNIAMAAVHQARGQASPTTASYVPGRTFSARNTNQELGSSTPPPVAQKAIQPRSPQMATSFDDVHRARSSENSALGRISGPGRNSGRPRGPRRPPTIDFARLRERVSGATQCRSSRVEESAVGMLFARCGGRAFPSDFGSIATLCGLPTCTSFALHAASKAWSAAASGDGVASPSLSPVSIMSFGDSSQEGAGREKGDMTCSPLRSASSSRCSIVELMDQQDEHQRQADGISYETFKGFWNTHLRRRDSETRLYNVLRIAYNSECIVPVRAVEDLAASLVSTRSNDVHGMEMQLLAASVLCYEIKGAKWNWIRRRELAAAEVCAALLAAESGMYNGVAAHLRADRMADIKMAFAAASGKRVHGNQNLSARDVAWLNSERGLLTHLAVESLFDGLPEEGMGLGAFGPMWLAVSNPTTRPSFEYLFSILDVNSDGYVTSRDVAHFYAGKRNMLMEEGFVPTPPKPIWQSTLDSVAATKSDSCMRNRVSISDIRNLPQRDATQLFQSMLFIEDEYSLVDLRATATHGSPEARAAVAVV